MKGPHKKWIGAGIVLAVLIFTAVVFYFIGRPMLQFVSEPEQFRAWVDEHGVWSRIAFIGMVVFQVIFAVIPGEPLEIGAGYAFGVWEGTLLSSIGAVFGGALVLLLVRRFGVKLVEIFFSREKIQSLGFMKSSRRLELFTFLVFLIPGTPKDLISYFAGLTPISLSHFLLISGVARLPSIITSTIGGDALGEKQYLAAGIIFCITVVLSLAGIWYYRRLCKKEETDSKNAPPD